MENEKMVKHIVTQEDIDANAAFVTEGIKVGDEIEIPAESVQADADEAKAEPKEEKTLDEKTAEEAAANK